MREAPSDSPRSLPPTVSPPCAKSKSFAPEKKPRAERIAGAGTELNALPVTRKYIFRASSAEIGCAMLNTKPSMSVETPDRM